MLNGVPGNDLLNKQDNKKNLMIQLVVLNVLIALTGFLKDLLIAAYLGTGQSAAAFGIAYFVPDALGSSMAGSALLISFTSVFSAINVQGNPLFIRHFVRRLLVGLILVFGIITIILWLFKGFLMSFIIGQVPYLSLSIYLLQVILPILWLYPLQFALSGILQSHGRFILANATPFLLNLSLLIVMMVLFVDKVPVVTGVIAMAATIPVVVSIYSLILWRKWSTLQAMNIRLTGISDEESTGPLVKKLLQTFFWFLLYLAASQIVGFFERGVSARMMTGMLAGLTYAFRLAQFPQWVFIAAITTWILPTLSKSLAKKQYPEAKKTLTEALKWSLIVTVPATIFLFILPIPVVGILFARGSFGPSSVWVTAELLRGYALAIMPLSINTVLFRYFAADFHLSYAVLSAFLGSIINIVFDWWIASKIGPIGLGLGSFLGNVVNLLTLWVIFQRTWPQMRYSASGVFTYLWRFIIPAMFTVGSAIVLLGWWNGWLFDPTVGIKVIVFMFISGVWGIGYVLILNSLRLISLGKGRVSMI